jgi:hypothetical protein
MKRGLCHYVSRDIFLNLLIPRWKSEEWGTIRFRSQTNSAIDSYGLSCLHLATKNLLYNSFFKKLLNKTCTKSSLISADCFWDLTLERRSTQQRHDRLTAKGKTLVHCSAKLRGRDRKTLRIGTLQYNVQSDAFPERLAIMTHTFSATVPSKCPSRAMIHERR